MAIEIAKAERNPTVALCFPMLAPLLSPAGQFCITGTLWCYLEAPLEGIWEPGSTPSCWQALGGHSASRINCGCFLPPRAEPASVVFLVLSQNRWVGRDLKAPQPKWAGCSSPALSAQVPIHGLVNLRAWSTHSSGQKCQDLTAL